MKNLKEGKNQSKVLNISDFKSTLKEETGDIDRAKELTREEMLLEEIEDSFLMGKQDAIYQSVATFLMSDEAISGHIIGVKVVVEDGYVNCYWEFGERK